MKEAIKVRKTKWQEVYDHNFLFGDRIYLEVVLGDSDILTKEQKKIAEREASESKNLTLYEYISENPNWQEEERSKVRIKKMRNC